MLGVDARALSLLRPLPLLHLNCDEKPMCCDLVCLLAILGQAALVRRVLLLNGLPAHVVLALHSIDRLNV